MNPGDVIAGKYRVERVLGSGGMGIVVEATHLTLEEKVAVKFLKPEALENAASVARFAREARAAAKIKSEHVCRVLDVVVDGGMPYLVMEYLEGRDLDDIVEKSGGIPPADAVDYILQACEALAEAHVAGIIHRDLKPANLFLSRRADGSPVIKVLDFGISKIQPKPGSNDAAMTATSSLLGSPLYMSPEQMKATRDVDVRTDIWSVGVILYEVLTGARPFSGDTIPQICANILGEPPAPIPGRVPPALERVIFRCLEKRPDDRFQTIAELAEALRPSAPSHALLSIERVTRVVGGSPMSAARPAPAAPKQAAVQAWASPTLPADSGSHLAMPQRHPREVIQPNAGAFAASGEAPPNVGIGTNATFESERRPGGTVEKSRAALIAVAGVTLVCVLGGAAFLVLRPRHPAAATNPAPAAIASDTAPPPQVSPPPPVASALPAAANASPAPEADAGASAPAPLAHSAKSAPRLPPRATPAQPKPAASSLALPGPAIAPKPSGNFGGRD